MPPPDRLPWTWLVLAVLSAGLLVAAVVAILASQIPLGPNIQHVGLAAFPVVGGLVVARRPGSVVGRLMIAIGLFLAVAGAATTHVLLGQVSDAVAASDLSAWLALWAYFPAFALICVLMATFPGDRIQSTWIRAPLWGGVVAVGVLTAILMVLPVPVNETLLSDDLTNPWGIAALAPLSWALNLLALVANLLIVMVTFDLVLRWRRSVGIERLQMRWAGLGLLVVACLGLTGFAIEVLGLTNDLVWIATWTGFGALPASVGIAVTRYRLYEIDRLISRTVTYLVVVATLALVYAGGVLLLGALLPVQGSDLAVATSTLAAVVLFSPLRRRVQLRVDRRFNRARYDAARTIDAFGARLRDQLDLDGIAGDLLRVTTTTMQPASVAIWFPDNLGGKARYRHVKAMRGTGLAPARGV